MKTVLDFGYGGRWRRLHVATLLNASLLQSSTRLAALVETLDLDLPDRTMMMRDVGWWHHFWN
jgi:hypothetical protein